MYWMLAAFVINVVVFGVYGTPGICKNGLPCIRHLSHEKNNFTDNSIVINDVRISCSSISRQATNAYNAALGNFMSAAENLQLWLKTAYGGNWAVLYSTNFGMAFTYVYPNVCQFTLSNGVSCAMFEETT